MKKLLIASTLSLLAMSAHAEWTLTGGNEVASVYIDKASIKKEGDVATGWTLFDLKKATVINNKAAFSFVVKTQINCKNETSSVLSSISYEKNMQEGNVIYTDNTKSNASPIPPGTSDFNFYKIICEKAS
jgi:hypothetical protein